MRDAIDSNGNARPPARRKLTLLVGHDTNISNIGGMLGMHWALPSYLADQTPPAGALHFELLRDRDSGSYAVRVSYIAQTLDQMRHAVQLDRSRPPEQTTATIEGCPTKDGETCAWPTFDALASKAIDHACLGARRKQAEAQARARYSTLMSQGHTDINNGDYDRAIVAFSDDGKLKATPFQANRVLAVIGSMYAFAGRTGVVPEDVNPARRIEQFKEHRRERFLTGGELERLGSAIREAETKGIPWDVDKRKPKAKHLPKTKNRFTKIGPFAVAALRPLSGQDHSVGANHGAVKST